MSWNFTFAMTCGLLCLVLAGCGTTKSQRATEQLLISDAVDRAVANINFSRLAGKTVYLDTQYMIKIKGDGVVDSNYIISSLRQQMVAANCHLEDDRNKAEYIVEARVGALATDSHDVVYGVPASRELSTAAALLPNAPIIPAIPEIAIAKRQDEMGATKIAVFAYCRETREPVWQSGMTKTRSKAKSVWLFGAGPFQSGTVYDHTQFAGEELALPRIGANGTHRKDDPLVKFNREVFFGESSEEKDASQVLQAGYTEAKGKPSAAAPTAKLAPAKNAKPAESPKKPEPVKKPDSPVKPDSKPDATKK